MTIPTISLIVTEQLYSALGNVLCTTIPVVKGSDNLLGFADTLVSIRNPLDANSQWPMGGPFDTDSDVVNWAWANNSEISETDRQYAYQGNFPEADPLLRKMQSSQAGQVFSIDGETGSANHSTNYTAGYLPSGVESTLPAPLIDEDNTTSLYTELICNGSEVSLGDLGNHYRACVRDFEGKILAKAQVNESGEILLSTSLYQIGAALSSQSSQPYIKSTSTFLPDYYASSDTSQSITTQTNFLKQNIAQISVDRGSVINYYDVYGRLRFSQNADQTTAGTVIYYLYDILDRLIETGFLSMSWDISTFQDLTSDTDASQFPAKILPASVTPQVLRQWSYDQAVNKDNPNFVLETIGKVMQTSTWNTILNSKNAVLINADSALVEQCSYDYLRRCSEVTQTLNSGTSYITSYAYDSLNRITSTVYPQAADSTTDFTVYRTYYIQACLSALGSASNASLYASYQYNEFGQIIQENLGSNGQAVNYTYGNTVGQLTAYTDAYQLINVALNYTDSSSNYQDGNIQSVSYSFPNTSILTVNDTAVQAYSYDYTYDAFGRLTAADAEDSDNNSIEAWTLNPITVDANNNLQSYTLGGVSSIYTYKTGNKVENINNGTNFTYSDSGLTLTTPNGLSLSYDLLISLPTTVVTSSDTLTFIYNSQSERYQKSNGNTTITYLRGLSTRPLVEIIQDSTAATTDYLYYIYGARGLAIINDSNNNYVVIKDHQGSVRIVHEDTAKADLSATDIVGFYNYLPYGSMMSDNSQQNANLLACRYLYTGQEWDSESNLYNYHARQYDPVLARFYAPDPAHQYASPYAYVSNNPINFIDKNGQVLTEGAGAQIELSEVIGLFVDVHKTVLVAEIRVLDFDTDTQEVTRYRTTSDDGVHAEDELTEAISGWLPKDAVYNMDIIINQSPCEPCAQILFDFIDGYKGGSITIQFAMAARATGADRAPTLAALRELADTGRVSFSPINVEQELRVGRGLEIADYVYDRAERALDAGRFPSETQLDNVNAYYSGLYTKTDKAAANYQKANNWANEIHSNSPSRDEPMMTFNDVLTTRDAPQAYLPMTMPYDI